MKIARFTIIVTVAFVFFLGCLILILSKRSKEYIGPMPDSELVLTKVWNGEVVHVPGLLKVPQWMKQAKKLCSFQRETTVVIQSPFLKINEFCKIEVRHTLYEENLLSMIFFIQSVFSVTSYK